MNSLWARRPRLRRAPGPALISQLDGGRRTRQPQATGLPHLANFSANCGPTTLVSGARDLRQYRLGIGLGELLRFVRVVHRTELRPAHRAERRVLEAFFRQGLVVIGARGLRVERQLKLLIPVEG